MEHKRGQQLVHEQCIVHTAAWQDTSLAEATSNIEACSVSRY